MYGRIFYMFGSFISEITQSFLVEPLFQSIVFWAYPITTTVSWVSRHSKLLKFSHILTRMCCLVHLHVFWVNKIMSSTCLRGIPTSSWNSHIRTVFDMEFLPLRVVLHSLLVHLFRQTTHF